MLTIYYNDQKYLAKDGESVLDALLREGVDIPHGCKAGACHSCMMQSLNDSVKLPANAQAGLKDSHKQLGYFLSCSCKPSEDIYVKLADQSGEKFSAEVVDKHILSQSVLRLRFKSDMSFKAGQYFNIWLDDNTVRSYSIASLPSEGFLEIHVRLIPDGVFSGKAKHQLQIGDQLTIQGPLGDCIYTDIDPNQPLLLAGIGTGLAPLYGIIKNALTLGHTGGISLFLGAKDETGFYLLDELNALTKLHTNFQLHCFTQSPEHSYEQSFAHHGQSNNGQSNNSLNVQQGDIYQAIQQSFPSTKGMRIYLCGAETFVRKIKKQCFLAGASMKEIHSDAFLACG